jgi:hypothetical protein
MPQKMNKNKRQNEKDSVFVIPLMWIKEDIGAQSEFVER